MNEVDDMELSARCVGIVKTLAADIPLDQEARYEADGCPTLVVTNPTAKLVVLNVERGPDAGFQITIRRDGERMYLHGVSRLGTARIGTIEGVEQAIELMGSQYLGTEPVPE